MKTTSTSFLTALAAFASLVSAHFNLEYPTVRDFDEDKLGTFPCGSFDTVSSTRTPWPISGGSIALKMGHIQANVEVLLALGNDPGSAFNTVIRPTFSETGLGEFCMTGLSVPSSLNVTDGMNATIQVVTNGDPDGGLYNCADITFTAGAAPASGVCTNGTGVTASGTTIKGNPNETTTGGSTTTSSAPATTSTKSAAGKMLNAGFGGLAVVGAAALAIVL